MTCHGLQELAARLHGEVLDRAHPGYDAARALWNGRFDRRPALIARCQDAADVATAVRHAHARGLAVSVRGGGHDYAGRGMGDGALALDLSALDQVEVDAASRRVRVAGGATWADVDRATQAHGLATPGATVSPVGVGGFVLGGGHGHLSRRFGLACDNLLSVDLVTADGTALRASADQHADLFWALRGGGGNFGVATGFEFRLHPLGPQVLAGQLVHRWEDAGAVLRHWRECMATAPDALQCWAFLLRLPPVEGVPAALHGAPVLDLLVVHAEPNGDLAALQALRRFGKPVLDSVAALPYADLQQAFDAGMAAKGRRWYSRALHLRGLPDAAIDTLLAHAGDLPGDATSVYLGAGGGAVARQSADACAYPHRDAAFSLHAFPGWNDPASDEPIMAWTRSLHAAMQPHAERGVYVNMLAEDEDARIPAAMGGNYARLAALKRRWDPDNRFCFNQNIPPAPASATD